MSNPTAPLDMIEKLGGTGFANLRELAGIQYNVFNKVVDTQLEMFNYLVNCAESQCNLLNESKDLETAFKAQVDSNRELAEGMMEKTRKCFELVQETSETYCQWAEKAIKESAEQVQSAEKAA